MRGYFFLRTVAVCLLFIIIFGQTNINAKEITAKSQPNFSFENIVEKAQNLSKKDFKPQTVELNNTFKNMSYDDFRDIRFLREKGPWFNKKLPFELHLFHLGNIFHEKVTINEIDKGIATPLRYNKEFFDFGRNRITEEIADDLGYAGFRLHYPLNRPTYYDELIAFLGASYFRCLGQGNGYGLSSRGLAIDTGEQTGEEFPVFREFWLEKPKNKSKEIRIYALLDSSSVTGAYNFLITPGKNTKIEVEAKLFPRKNIKKLGISPLTSMFLFGENNKYLFDDYRGEVHDSDGLLLNNGAGEWIWRPLDNSRLLRISSFEDNNPKGFGLLQRDRMAEHYQDFESKFENRPTVWVEPLENWGKGTVQLIEIPSDKEINDNIVAFWIPSEPILAGKEYNFKYRLSWGNDIPIDNKLSFISSTYTGVGGVSGTNKTHIKKFVIDFKGDNLKKLKNEDIIPEISVTEGNIDPLVLEDNPLTGGKRVYVDFYPNDKVSEIRINLKSKDKIISEIWSYQWLQ